MKNKDNKKLKLNKKTCVIASHIRVWLKDDADSNTYYKGTDNSNRYCHRLTKEVFHLPSTMKQAYLALSDEQIDDVINRRKVLLIGLGGWKFSTEYKFRNVKKLKEYSHIDFGNSGLVNVDVCQPLESLGTIKYRNLNMYLVEEGTYAILRDNKIDIFVINKIKYNDKDILISINEQLPGSSEILISSTWCFETVKGNQTYSYEMETEEGDFTYHKDIFLHTYCSIPNVFEAIKLGYCFYNYREANDYLLKYLSNDQESNNEDDEDDQDESDISEESERDIIEEFKL